ncbi:MAG: hypothetical protein HYU99_10875, partial [Deltaproteobacteria bacterium]|nr:hypothetical protein [Deltaproteobacteria bacterium]
MKHLFSILALWSGFFLCGVSHAASSSGGRGVSALVTGSGGSNSSGATVQADEFTGAATYSIALPVPPAVGGMEPQLNLNYNSYRKNPNSWVGYGWELDLGVIERTTGACEGDLDPCNTIDYYEGTHFQVKLGGQSENLQLEDENISASNYGLSGIGADDRIDLYEGSIQNGFNLYFHIRDYSNADDIVDKGWIVVDKSGRSYTFGDAEEAREECDDGYEPCGDQQWVARWFLTKVTDPNGNELIVTYDDDRLPATASYDDITITFGKSASPHPTYPYFPTYRQGFIELSWTGGRLEEIEISSSSGPLQKFSFDYDVSDYGGRTNLSSITQYGASDAESLPPTTFEYYDENSIEWDATPQTRTASTSASGGESTGYLNKYTQIIDMNGDGLADMVTSYEDSYVIYVYFNNGNDFEYISGKSEWNEPYYFDCGSWCTGRLNSYLTADNGETEDTDDQWAYVIDMNGDSLPDRVYGIYAMNEENAEGSFYIYLNNGAGWSSTVEVWKDPFVGDDPGASDFHRGLIDMNGDGLVDRVVGDKGEGGFYVYYNTGAGFRETAVFWADPLAAADPDASGVGALYDYDTNEDDETVLQSVIRDFNGDGLPDRMWQTTIHSGGVELGKGIAMSLNRNGFEWAEREVDADGYGIIDGIDNLGFLDPIEDEEDQGYISGPTWDLIDFNGDGYLDRIEGRKDDDQFIIYFYEGMTSGSVFSELHSFGAIDDPLGASDDYAGYVTKKNDDGHIHTFFQDMNGDGYPDRVAVRPTGNSTPKEYNIYFMRVNTVEFSDSPSDWEDTEVTQPVGALKEVDDGSGNELAIEYLPSTWPLRENSSSLPFNNRFLPFNLYLAHKIYSLDYTMPSSDGSTEADRNPGKRWTTYNYWGGNLYVRYAERTDPSATDLLTGSDTTSDIDTAYFMQFNGFQTVEKKVYQSASESWDDFTTTTIYHQATGDVDIVDSADESSFEQNAYDDFDLSGKVYSTQIATDLQTVVLEENDWEIASSTNFPYLKSTTKQVWEDGATSARTSSVASEYDETNGNLTGEKYYDGSNNLSNNLLLEKTTTYTDKSSFDTELQMQDRPQTQSQKDSSGTVYRYKEFGYDTTGNPSTETFKVDSGGTTVSVSRSFNTNGTVTDITDIDGVTKTIGYGADQLFPEIEAITLPTGGTLTTTREFNRLNGKASRELNDYNIGKQTEYDDFGRPIAEYVIDSGGGAETIKEYSYEYVSETVEDWKPVTLLKTQIWQIMPDHADTETNPAQIAYTDGAGNILQQCTYTERGNYRLVQFRQYNGGREEYKTEPVFSSGCDFISTISSSSVTYLTEKDIQ